MRLPSLIDGRRQTIVSSTRARATEFSWATLRRAKFEQRHTAVARQPNYGSHVQFLVPFFWPPVRSKRWARAKF